MKEILKVVFVLGFAFLFVPNGFAHCQVPCGIYDDEMRIEQIHEDITTIEKAMVEIKDLSDAGDKNYNQIARWIQTKEEHANKIQETVYQYFMTQRIKPVDEQNKDGYEKYIYELMLLHTMLIEAMKSKQTLDASHPQAIHDAAEAFHQSYFGIEEKEETK